MGGLVLMPLIGNLSDHYGRKPLLTFPMMLAILPTGKNILKNLFLDIKSYKTQTDLNVI